MGAVVLHRELDQSVHLPHCGAQVGVEGGPLGDVDGHVTRAGTEHQPSQPAELAEVPDHTTPDHLGNLLDVELGDLIVVQHLRQFGHGPDL